VVDREEGPFEMQLKLLQGYRHATGRGAAVAPSSPVADDGEPPAK
jgi:hypothetical protein